MLGKSDGVGHVRERESRSIGPHYLISSFAPRSNIHSGEQTACLKIHSPASTHKAGQGGCIAIDLVANLAGTRGSVLGVHARAATYRAAPVCAVPPLPSPPHHPYLHLGLRARCSWVADTAARGSHHSWPTLSFHFAESTRVRGADGVPCVRQGTRPVAAPPRRSTRQTPATATPDIA